LLHGRGWRKNQLFWHLMSETARMILSVLYSMICISRYVQCSKRLRAFIWWSTDNSKNILMYFRRTKNMFCMRKWQIVHCNVLYWLCHIYSWNFISILGYLFWVIRWHNKMEESSMMTWMSSNVEHCDGYCNEGSVYNCSRSSKRTRCSSKCASTM
jgi:hypothetical protein